MPIIVPNGLPATETLRTVDGIKVIEQYTAERQDIRPQEYAVLNLMPGAVKKRTERQLARLLGHTSLQVQLTLLHPGTTPDTEDEHLASFYKPWEVVQDTQYDGLIVTGAPIEHLEWEDVRYWDELRRIMDWSRKNVTTRVYICWGAQAALHHLYGHEKQPLNEKAFGVHQHTLENDTHPLVAGFDDEFFVPVSRHTEIPLDQIRSNPHLSILSSSSATGGYLIADKGGRDIFMFNHPEYGKSSLGSEYERDVRAGLPINTPVNYFRNNDPTQPPVNRWRAHARALYANILDQIYQRTPYDIEEIHDLPENLPYVEFSNQS